MVTDNLLDIFDFGSSEEEKAKSADDPKKRMYQAPIHKIDVDSAGNMLKK